MADTGCKSRDGLRSMEFAAARATVAALALAGMLATAGCAVSTEATVSTVAGLNCVDDSMRCIGERQSALRQMTSDSTRGWVLERPTPNAYASGVRLFAYKTKKAELSCEELKRGQAEADAGPGVLRASTGSLSPAQISRGVILAGEVSRELARERKRRC
ncbi:MAG: hypothetical protein NW217_03320 [Hyphomicrobiaceae bacterium]|nr:hypothetical protein [Hyphomicrobiaceae bacterium]